MNMGDAPYVDWRIKGPCTTLSPKDYDRLFFPAKGRSINEAKKFCAGCKVNNECLRLALETKAEGIWAGTTWKERQRILIAESKLREIGRRRRRRKIISRGIVTLTA